MTLLEIGIFQNNFDVQSSPLPQGSLCWRILPADSESSGPCPLPQVSLCWITVEHLFAILENPTLRRDWNFDLRLHQASLIIQRPRASRRNRTVHRWRTCSNRAGQVHPHWPGFSHNPVLFWLFLHPLRHPFGDAAELIKLRFLAQQRELKWLMLNKQRRLFHSSRVKCLLVRMSAIWCLVKVPFLFLGVQIDSVKQPIQSNPVGSWNMSHCGTSVFDNHFNCRLIVFKDIQHCTGIRNLCIGWNVINVC